MLVGVSDGVWSVMLKLNAKIATKRNIILTGSYLFYLGLLKPTTYADVVFSYSVHKHFQCISDITLCYV